jgi:hypothetical protein
MEHQVYHWGIKLVTGALHQLEHEGAHISNGSGGAHISNGPGGAHISNGPGGAHIPNGSGGGHILSAKIRLIFFCWDEVDIGQPL